MEIKIQLAYEQVLEIIKQLPANQIAKLLIDTKGVLEKHNKPSEINDFQKFLLSAPVMSDEQHDLYVENRKLFNQWRTK